MLSLKTFSRKKALLLVLAVAAVLLVLIGLKSLFYGKGPDLDSIEGRLAFVEELGWEVDAGSEEFRTVKVPEKLEGIMGQYNKMQLAQGYDLSLYLGQTCQQYSYQLTNYKDCPEPVFITLYILDGQLIAGDIHTNSINGFMHGLKTEKPRSS